MTTTAYAFLLLTALVAMVVGVLIFAVLRFAAAARAAKRPPVAGGDSLLLAAALEEALVRLKAQERATAARADASERLSSQIIASLTSGVIVVDADSRVTLANPAARRILRHDDGDSESVLSAIPGLADVIGESLAGRAPVVRRQIAVRRGDDTMHLGVTVSPLEAGGPAGAICLFSDLTSVVALEEQLRLKEALARLGELTAGLAHEFRNGLATIHGYSRLLKPDTLPPAAREYVDGIRSETHALGEVVNNFLRFAKPDPLMCADVDLRAVIRRAADDVPAAAVTMTGAFGAVWADDVLLRQAMNNLFRNSVEACATAGTEARVMVEGRTDPAEGVVVLTIADNGPGISHDAGDKVFQPFFTTRATGTGLGLAIVQKIVVSHNGRITVANRPGGGAVFTMTLPSSAPERAT